MAIHYNAERFRLAFVCAIIANHLDCRNYGGGYLVTQFLALAHAKSEMFRREAQQ